jgi:hypothetical protein
MPRNDSKTGHDSDGTSRRINGKELRQELAQKDPSLSSAEQAHLEKEIQETVMKYEKIYSDTPRTSNIIPLHRHSQNTIGHRNEG